MPKHICIVCSKEFCVRRKDSKYCSQECYKKYREKNYTPRLETRKGRCKTCETPILNIRVYCEKCRQEFMEKPRKRYKMTTNTTCSSCGVIKTLENSFSPEPGVWETKCRECLRKIKGKSKMNLKKECVEYKGGTCEYCGYNKSLAALDFHHKDPNEKEFSIAHKRGCKVTNEIKRELDKCILLCSNCHREEHEMFRCEEKIKCKKKKTNRIEKSDEKNSLIEPTKLNIQPLLNYTEQDISYDSDIY